jgi:hypothetical protein
MRCKGRASSRPPVVEAVTRENVEEEESERGEGVQDASEETSRRRRRIRAEKQFQKPAMMHEVQEKNQ